MLLRAVTFHRFLNTIRKSAPGRAFATSPALLTSRSLVKFKKLQADFQCKDGRPVFLKRGFCDRVLYSLTLFLCCVGLLYVVATLFEHAKPPSWRHVC